MTKPACIFISLVLACIGPNYGHIALRCMVHTKMVFRNLKVFTEQLAFTEVKAKQ